jgi:hypothetical protein
MCVWALLSSPVARGPLVWTRSVACAGATSRGASGTRGVEARAALAGLALF